MPVAAQAHIQRREAERAFFSYFFAAFKLGTVVNAAFVAVSSHGFDPSRFFIGNIRFLA